MELNEFQKFDTQAGAKKYIREAINRVALGLWESASETNPLFYGIRLVSYGLILLAIWQKNRG